MPRETGYDYSGAVKATIEPAAYVIFIEPMLVELASSGGFLGVISGTGTAGPFNGAAATPWQGDALIVRGFLQEAGVLSSNAPKMT